MAFSGFGTSAQKLGTTRRTLEFRESRCTKAAASADFISASRCCPRAHCSSLSLLRVTMPGSGVCVSFAETPRA